MLLGVELLRRATLFLAWERTLDVGVVWVCFAIGWRSIRTSALVIVQCLARSSSRKKSVLENNSVCSHTVVGSVTYNPSVKDRIQWPDDRSFAFSIFDDPDAQTLDGCRIVYDFLASLGLRTTIGVWPCRPIREPNSPGETCGNDDYLTYVRDLQTRGFEIGYHNTTPHSSFREEVADGLHMFCGYFDHERSITMANHYNAEAIYWGSDRLSGSRRSLYRMLQPGNSGRFFGNAKGSLYFWGDMCQEYVEYCRNFVFPEINTLNVCPFMPYHDPEKPFVKYWYASSEGANVESFVRTLSEPNQDRLEQEGGACLMYAHFGHGFVRDGKLDSHFRSLMTRLSKKKGWFVPAATLLDFLRQRNAGHVISASERRSIEWRWLSRKLIRGTS